jgi:hypothetical protein
MGSLYSELSEYRTDVTLLYLHNISFIVNDTLLPLFLKLLEALFEIIFMPLPLQWLPWHLQIILPEHFYPQKQWLYCKQSTYSSYIVIKFPASH